MCGRRQGLALKDIIILHKCVEPLPHAWYCSEFKEYHTDQHRLNKTNMCQVGIRGTDTRQNRGLKSGSGCVLFDVGGRGRVLVQRPERSEGDQWASRIDI